jgi:uncharacterized DUF497 family protein
VEAFYDPLNISKRERYKDGEWQWQTFGVIDGLELIMVVHTTWEEGGGEDTTEVINIVSARFATRRERREHENNNG